MKLNILFEGFKFFIIQTILEIIFIVGLMYLGFSYGSTEVGGKYMYEVIIAVSFYQGLFKIILGLIPYQLLFTAICYLMKYQEKKYFSRINAILSIAFLIVIKLLKNKEMSSVFIATFFSALLILIYCNYKPSYK